MLNLEVKVQAFCGCYTRCHGRVMDSSHHDRRHRTEWAPVTSLSRQMASLRDVTETWDLMPPLPSPFLHIHHHPSVRVCVCMCVCGERESPVNRTRSPGSRRRGEGGGGGGRGKEPRERVLEYCCSNFEVTDVGSTEKLKKSLWDNTVYQHRIN